jgi:hypothetical protein
LTIFKGEIEYRLDEADGSFGNKFREAIGWGIYTSDGLFLLARAISRLYPGKDGQKGGIS